MPNQGCKCMSWAQDGSGRIVTKHHKACDKYDLEGDARELIQDLLRGIEAWAAGEDGVHPDAYEAYKRAKIAIGEGFTENPDA